MAAVKKYPSQANYSTRMKAKGCIRVTLWTHASNESSVKAYARKKQTPKGE